MKTHANITPKVEGSGLTESFRDRIEEYAAAIRAKDLDGVMSIFSPDLVSFDLEPPLQHIGAEAKRKNWTSAFAAYEGPLGYEVHNLSVTVSEGVAFAHSLNRISGTLKNGNNSAYWIRWTPCFRKIDGNWLIVHDQVSVPLDFETGKALLNLEPDNFLNNANYRRGLGK